MNKNYECMVLLDNREVRQGWDALKANVAGMFTKHGANVISSRVWEERKLAYPIERQDRGTYLLVYFEAPTSEIGPINREMQMSEPILRHLVTVCEEIPDSAHEPEKEFNVDAIGKEPEVVEPPAEAEAEADAPAAAEDKAEDAAEATTEPEADAPADTDEAKENS